MILIPRNRARGIHLIRPAIQVFPRDCAGGEPGGDGAGFATRVAELDHDLLALGVGELDDSCQVLDLRVFPEADVFRGDAALGSYCCGFHAGDARAALDYAAHLDGCGQSMAVGGRLGRRTCVMCHMV